MTALSKTTRRDFVKLVAAAGGGLLLGFHWESTNAASMQVINEASLIAGDINFNIYLSISPFR
jgi:isoquinoline 1-oxidoreductase beta subunit